MIIGLLGYGTVGKGTHDILLNNATAIANRAGRPIHIKSASVRNLNRETAGEITLTREPKEIIEDAEIDIVCELIGGIDIAYELVKAAILQGKHVVTANKALIAIHGNELFELAHKHGRILAFEAAVAGGIPIIKSLREGLAANQIEWLAGIINGTGNFILSKMRDEASTFADALAEAQALGYAEADPTYDVEGIDAAHKLCILAAIAFDIPLQFDAIYTEGISKIQSVDVEYASKLGYEIKHLGIAKKVESGIELRVHPTLLPKSHMLAKVNDVMNGIFIEGDAVGPTLYYGPGAGAKATGSAVVADLIDIVRAVKSDPDNRISHLAYRSDMTSKTPICAIEQIQSAYYLRISGSDTTELLSDISQLLQKHHIETKAIISQDKDNDERAEHASIVILTMPIQEALMNIVHSAIHALGNADHDVVVIRAETLEPVLTA